jgi:hypothetical protein
MAMVENYRHGITEIANAEITVERAMIAFKKQLELENDGGSKELRVLSLALAHTCRVSLGSSWGFKAAQLDGTYQELLKKMGSL